MNSDQEVFLWEDHEGQSIRVEYIM